MSGFLGRGAARFEIRDFAGAATDLLVSTPALGKSLAGCLGDKQLILMRGHGATLVGETVRHSVYRAIYAAINATVQAEAMRLGEVTYLFARRSRKRNEYQRSLQPAFMGTLEAGSARRYEIKSPRSRAAS